jgi:hypothetical protein
MKFRLGDCSSVNFRVQGFVGLVDIQGRHVKPVHCLHFDHYLNGEESGHFISLKRRPIAK